MMMTESVAKQYQKYLEADAQARKLWDRQARELRKLIKLAKLGRKHSLIVPISESRGLQITDQFRTREDRVFTPAFCKRYQVKEVPLRGE